MKNSPLFFLSTIFFLVGCLIFSGCLGKSEPFSEFDPLSPNFRPLIPFQNISVSNLTATSLQLFFRSPEASKGIIRVYRTDPQTSKEVLISEVRENQPTLLHQIELFNLEPQTGYSLVLSQEDLFNRVIKASGTFGFVTPPPFLSLLTGSKTRTEDMASSTGTFYADGIKMPDPIGLNNPFKGIATFLNPKGMALNPINGNIYVADSGNNAIRRVTPTGITSTVIGGLPFVGLSPLEANRQSASLFTLNGQDFTVSLSPLVQPFGLDISSKGEIYVADTGNHRIVKIENESTLPTVKIIAGRGFPGFFNGVASEALFHYPTSLCIDEKNNRLLVADPFNYSLRGIDLGTLTVVTLAGNGHTGYVDGAFDQAEFLFPSDVDVDGSGNIYILDVNRIRKLDQNGVVTTFLGDLQLGLNSQIFTEPKTLEPGSSRFGQLSSFEVTPGGVIFTVDPGNKKILKYDPNKGKIFSLLETDTITETIPSGTLPLSIASSSPQLLKNFPTDFNDPFGITLDSSGKIILSDDLNHELFTLNPR